MSQVSPTNPPLPPTSPPAGPVIPAGISTYFGFAYSLLAGVGAIVAGIEGNEPVAAAGGGSSVLALLVTVGGRMAQAVALIRQVATTAEPWIDAAQAALRNEPVEVTAVAELDYEDDRGA